MNALFWAAEDFATARRRIELEVEADRQPGERERLNALATFVETAECRRAILLRHFGDEAPDRCGNCDNCLEPPATIDATEVARKLLSAAFRTEMRFGVAHLAAVLEDHRLLVVQQAARRTPPRSTPRPSRPSGPT